MSSFKLLTHQLDGKPRAGVLVSDKIHDTQDETGTAGVVQKVTFLGNTDNVNFGWFAYDSTDGHPKKCYPILNHAPKY